METVSSSTLPSHNLCDLEAAVSEGERSTISNSQEPRSHSLSQILAPWNWTAFVRSEWFTRSWTLQQMIASSNLRFYNNSWILIGALPDLATDISHITGVHEKLLRKERDLKSYSIAQEMSWAANRKSTKMEDRAVSTRILHLPSMEPNLVFHTCTDAAAVFTPRHNECINGNHIWRG